MTTILTLTVSALTVALSVGVIWMAIWAWRTFGVSVFGWLVIVRIAGVARAFGLLNETPDRAEIESMIKALQTGSPNSLQEFLISTAFLTNVFPMLSMAGILLIALGELSHFGPRIVPSYVPHWSVNLVYRFRHWFGVFALICILAPSTALNLWIHSIN